MKPEELFVSVFGNKMSSKYVKHHKKFRRDLTIYLYCLIPVEKTKNSKWPKEVHLRNFMSKKKLSLKIFVELLALKEK